MCDAPWSRKCLNQSIVVFIHWKGKRIGICRQCWEKCPKNLEWGKGARTQKEVAKELKKVKTFTPRKEEVSLSDKKIKDLFENYIPFGKHALIRKDVAKKLKKKELNL